MPYGRHWNSIAQTELLLALDISTSTGRMLCVKLFSPLMKLQSPKASMDRQEQDELFRKSPESWSITLVGKAEEPDNYEYDYETGVEHYLDEEDPDYDIIATRTWPGHFQTSIFMLYGLWEHMSVHFTYAEE